MIGGARPGAGRKPGVPNKVTAKREAEIAQSGLTPLEYMLSILRDETQEDAARFEAAKQAAPYCHAKLAAMAVELDVGENLAAIIAERRARVAGIAE